MPPGKLMRNLIICCGPA